jgi:Ca-activated chloride channel family protein
VKPLTLLEEMDLRACCPVCDEPGLGAMATPRGNLPLKLLEVEARVVGLFAETEVRQTYVNTLGVPLEATYIFPLPDRAAATRFRLEVGERVVEGELQERGQARATYDRALRAGHRAAITEEERPGVFTLRVGNLMPGDEATVWLTLAGPLPFADGEATFQLPLVVAPRYIPGSDLPGEQAGDGVAHDTTAVPDASRISPPVLLPGFPSPVRLSITVDIDPAGLPLGAVRSSLHAVSEVGAPGDGGRTRVRLVPGERLDRDFILRIGYGGAALRSSLVLCPDEREPGVSTFCLTVVPPVEDARARRPKDVVLLLDRSGSMEGWKMVAARRATARMIDTLTPLDRFAVYAFDDQVETPSSFGGRDLVFATDRNRFRAVEFLAKLESRGGTELAQPLQQASRALLGSSVDGDLRDRVLVLVTDGQVGNEDQLLRAMGADLARLRVFTLGIDQAVNAAFLRRMAALGGGSCELVESEDRLDEVMDKVHRRIDTPVLSDVRVTGEGLELLAFSVVPARLPDLFPGAPLTVLGRCRGSGALEVRAVDASGMRHVESLAPTPRAEVQGARAITSAWARGLVRQLEDRYLIAPAHEQPELERRIVETSLRFSVLCRFTSFVAVDRAEVVNRGGNVHRVTQAVEQPAGWGEAEKQEEQKTRRSSTGGPWFKRSKMAPPTGAARGAPSPSFADPFGAPSPDPFADSGFPAPPAAPSPSFAPAFNASYTPLVGGGFGAPGAAAFGAAPPASEDPFASPLAPGGMAFGGAPPAGDPFGGDMMLRAAGDPFSAPSDPNEESGCALPLEADADCLDDVDPFAPAPPPRAASKPSPAKPAAPSNPVGGFFDKALGALGLGSRSPSPSAGKPKPPAQQPPPSAAPVARLGAPIPLASQYQAPPPPSEPALGHASFDGYRRRAEDLVKLLARQIAIATGLERQRELGRLIVLLERLLDDLRSVGAPGHLVQPLDDLVRELQVIRSHAGGQLDDREVERLWRRAADVLRDYVRGGGPVAPTTPTIEPPRSGTRREFWK